MTIQELHSLPKFTELFLDVRFLALMQYLRERRPKAVQKEPHGMIQDSGRIDAYLDFLDKIEESKTPPTIKPEIPRPPAYTSGTQLPISKENSK